MNILILARSTTLHFLSGGLETQLRNLIEGLAERNNKIYIITTSLPHKNISSNIKEVKNVPAYYYYEDGNLLYYFIKDTTPGLYPLSFYEKIFFDLGLLNRSGEESTKNYFIEANKLIKQLSKNINFDIVLSQSTAGRSLYNLKKPIIAIIHGTINSEIKSRYTTLKTYKNLFRFFVLDLPNWYLEKILTNIWFFRRCKYIVAVSQILKEAFISDYPYLSRKVKVIYNGVDHKKFIPSANKYKTFTMLYVGRLEREKGIDLGIRALRLLSQKDINAQFIIVGGGIHEEEFKELASELNVNNQVKFLGNVKNSEVSEYYRKSHVFVFPSRREEGHPMTISEAFLSGLPVIASKKGGLKELIENGRTGYHLEQENESEIAGFLETLYKNRRLLESMSENARKVGENKYSQKSMVTKYIDLIKLAVK